MPWEDNVVIGGCLDSSSGSDEPDAEPRPCTEHGPYLTSSDWEVGDARLHHFIRIVWDKAKPLLDRLIASLQAGEEPQFQDCIAVCKTEIQVLGSAPTYDDVISRFVDRLVNKGRPVCQHVFVVVSAGTKKGQRPKMWVGFVQRWRISQKTQAHTDQQESSDASLKFPLYFSSQQGRATRCNLTKDSGTDLYRIGQDFSKHMAGRLQAEQALSEVGWIPKVWNYFFKTGNNPEAILQEISSFALQTSQKAADDLRERLMQSTTSIQIDPAVRSCLGKLDEAELSKFTEKVGRSIYQGMLSMLQKTTEKDMPHDRYREEQGHAGLDDGTARSDADSPAAQTHKRPRTSPSPSLDRPDFVFACKTYARLSLQKIEAFLSKHNHLPWMKSAEEVEEDGFDVESEFNDLLESVENIMLLLIDIGTRLDRIELTFKADHDDMIAVLEGQTQRTLWRVLVYSGHVKLQPSTGTGTTTRVGPGSSSPSESGKQDLAKLVLSVMSRLGEKDKTTCMRKYYTKILQTWTAGQLEENILASVQEVKEGKTGKTAPVFLKRFKNFELECGRAHKAARNRPEKWTPRGYQNEMARAAIETNRIIVAETGCGKTNVLAMVLDDLWKKKGSAKAVVLVHTVPLTSQQLGKLKAHCAELTSGSRPRADAYGSFNPLPADCEWDELIAEHEVLLFTPQALLNLWDRLSEYETTPPQFLSSVDLLAFDECHHCTKDHPFHSVMQKHFFPLAAEMRPRVLGLTACIGGAESQGKSLQRITHLEHRLSAQVFSTFDLTSAAAEELRAQAVLVQEKFQAVKINALEKWFEQQSAALLTKLTKRWDLKKTRLGPSSGIAEILRECVGMVDEAIRVERDAGGFPSVIVNRFSELSTMAMSGTDTEVLLPGVYEALSWLAGTYLSFLLDGQTEQAAGQDLLWIQVQFNESRLFNDLNDESWLNLEEPAAIGQQSSSSSSSSSSTSSGNHKLFDDEGYARNLITEKQKALLQELQDLAERDDGFQGIIFFRTRHGVKTARNILTDVSHGRRAGFEQYTEFIKTRIRPRTMVGTGTKHLSDNASHQLKTAKAFRDKEFNLLLATSVAEEGMDFVKCNAVFRMDGADSDIALTQTKGRVRSHGHFILLYRDDDAYETAEKRILEIACEKRRNAEQALQELASSRRKDTQETLALATERRSDFDELELSLETKVSEDPPGSKHIMQKSPARETLVMGFTIEVLGARGFPDVGPRDGDRGGGLISATDLPEPEISTLLMSNTDSGGSSPPDSESCPTMIADSMATLAVFDKPGEPAGQAADSTTETYIPKQTADVQVGSAQDTTTPPSLAASRTLLEPQRLESEPGTQTGSRALNTWSTDEVCNMLKTLGPKFQGAMKVCQEEEVSGLDLAAYLREAENPVNGSKNPLYMPIHPDRGLGLCEIQVRKLRREVLVAERESGRQ